MKHDLSRIVVWLRALRLPFYPMSWLGYSVGASLVMPLPQAFRQPVYWWGYMVVFFVEALTVFLNDLHDYESDRRNFNHGAFTGGSRVLVDGSLTPADLRRGCMIVAAGAMVGCLILQSFSPAPLWANAACLGTAVLFGVGYTVPPLKFSHRGLGEIVVAIAHSLLVVQCGSLVLGGSPGDAAVLQAGLPLMFAVLPSISLSGLPDREADEVAGKRTLAVKFGPHVVLVVAILSTLAACALVIHRPGRWPSWAIVAMAVHAMLVIVVTLRQWHRSQGRRIDGVMAASLSYVLWFSVVPLLSSAGFIPLHR